MVVETADLVALWQEQRLSLPQIATRVGMSRQGVKKRLNLAGVSTAKGKRWGVTCALCSVEFELPRNRMRRGSKHFCSQEHALEWLRNPEYRPWRNGQRIGRSAVAKRYKLLVGQVVHHKDGDNRNNDLRNLAVFASQSDHLRYHHGAEVRPVWDGAEVDA